MLMKTEHRVKTEKMYIQKSKDGIILLKENRAFILQLNCTENFCGNYAVSRFHFKPYKN